jgi:hypothetical protein
MKNLFDAQPDLSQGLYSVWHRGSGLVTRFPDDKRRDYLVDAGKTIQRYYQYGIPAAFLACLAGATGDEAWLQLGRRYLHASRHCREDVYREPQSGKIGWGAAWTYRLTRAEEDRRIAETVAAGLRATQHPEGWWSSVNVYEREMARSLEPSLDVTAEFIAHLSWIENALDEPGRKADDRVTEPA